MGNGNFIGRNSIYMQLDRPYVVAGQMLSGTIFLNITSEEGFQSKGIFLQLEGNEMARFEEEITDHVDRDGDGDTMEKRIVTRHDSNEFIDMKIPIHQFRELLMPGQYSYPFNVMIPAGLPASFYESGDRHGRPYTGRVNYKLSCECDSSGFLSRDIEYEVQIVMLECALSAIEQPVVECTESVMFCCCVNKGDVYIRAGFDKNAYMPGENAYIVVDIRNDSESNVDEINAKLMRSLRLRADHETFSHTEVMREVTIPGVPPGESRDQLRVALPMTYEQKWGKDFDQVKPGVNSRHVTCNYYICVEASVPMAPDIQLHLPITIYNAAPEYALPEAPPGWSPMENEVAVFDDSQQYVRKGNWGAA